MNIAIVGASKDRTKFGNKAVRAYLAQGHRVFPVNPHATVIEEIRAYPSLDSIRDASGEPLPLDTVSIYLPPELTEKILPEIAALKIKPSTIIINPGAESDNLVRISKNLNLNVVMACSIRKIGEDPADFP